MELQSLYRMMRANAMDTDNKSHRTCVRWDDDKRKQLVKLAQRTDGTAPHIARVTGMSTTAVRREAKRLGISLQPLKGRTHKTSFDPHAFVYQTMLTHLAIALDMDAPKVRRWIESISTHKVVNDDNKLKPMMRDQWKALDSFSYPFEQYPHYKINDIHDDVLKKYHRLYNMDTISNLLRFSPSSIVMRCRELGTGLRGSDALTDVQVVWLVTMKDQLVAVDTLVEITGLPLEGLLRITESHEFWRQHRD